MLKFYVLSAGQWHWQVYYMPEQIQSSTITKKNTKKWSSFRKNGFQLITVWFFQTKNSKLSRLALENKTKEPQNLKGNYWRWTL